VRVRAINAVKQAWGVPTSPAFAAMCVELARSALQRSNVSFVAQKDDNLAVLFAELRLSDKLPLGDLARDCFTWICGQHQLGIKDWRARLQMVKNSAYAWRQMVFFITLAQPATREKLIAWAIEHLRKQGARFRG
jgi:hypothetical protein